LALPSAWGRTSRLHLAAWRRSPSFSSPRAGMVERSFSPTLDRTCRSAGHGFLPVASTVPRPHTIWFLPVGVCEGPCVSATSTFQPAWVETQDCCGCSITPDMLDGVWQEWDYRLDVCRVTNGAHTGHLWCTLPKLEQLLFHPM
jgi:hypothetical protein